MPIHALELAPLDPMTELTPRPLTTDERRVLDLLLSGTFVGADELRQQAAQAMVTGRCDCGCPTVDLSVAQDAPPAPVIGPTAPVEVQVTPVGGEPVGDVLLFVKAGRLSSLEYVYYTDSPPQQWPPADRMTVVAGPPRLRKRAEPGWSAHETPASPKHP